MGYNTDLIGYVNVTPALNDAEVEYLTAFSESRRWDRPDGPYVVPGNPALPEEFDDVEAYNRPAPGEPGLWCCWVPCGEGCCLAYNGREKFYEPTAWLEYLIDTFLRPDAVAATSGDSSFDHFTFDHRVDGTIAAQQRDTRRLWLIVTAANEVTERTLVDGASAWEDWTPLPYQAADDKTRQRANRRRRPR